MSKKKTPEPGTPEAMMAKVSGALSVKQVARMTGRHAETVKRWIGSKRLRAFKFGNAWRVKRDDLTAFISSQVGDEPAEP